MTSTPPGIDCGSTCAASFAYGALVTLSAIPVAGSHFVAWSGDPDCSDGVVIMDADKSCTATFDLGPPLDLELHDLIVDTVQTYEACRSITAWDFTVVYAGSANLRAGSSVVLGDDFFVEENCPFTVEIQSPNGCP